MVNYQRMNFIYFSWNYYSKSEIFLKKKRRNFVLQWYQLVEMKFLQLENMKLNLKWTNWKFLITQQIHFIEFFLSFHFTSIFWSKSFACVWIRFLFIYLFFIFHCECIFLKKKNLNRNWKYYSNNIILKFFSLCQFACNTFIMKTAKTRREKKKNVFQKYLTVRKHTTKP